MSQVESKLRSNHLKFIDLVGFVSPQELAVRTKIDKVVDKAAGLEDLLLNWQQLSLVLEHDVSVQCSVKKNAKPESKMGASSFCCKLLMYKNNELALDLQFWVKEAPVQLGTNTESPISLYHTKVKTVPIADFSPFRYYDALMYLIRRAIPERTQLMLYVRQRDSRKMLDEGAAATDIPLTKVFMQAGWEFFDYKLDRASKDELRRHRLTVIA